MKKIFLLPFLILVFAFSAFGQSEIYGRVVEIVDGKTVVILVSTGSKFTAELQYLEVPESEQPLHQTVVDHLRQIALNQKIVFKAHRLVNTKTIGQLMVGGVDVSQQMIRDGAAWYNVEEQSGLDNERSAVYRQNEAQAKADKLGVWSIADLKPSWQIRAERAEIARQNERLAAEKAAKSAQEAAAAEAKNKKAASAARPKLNSEAKMWAAGDEAKMPANYQNVGGLLVGYNPQFKFGIVATPLVKFQLLDQGESHEVGVGAGYFYADSGAKGRESFYFVGIESESVNFNFLEANEMTVFADKQKINIGKAKRRGIERAGSVKESLSYQISPAILAKIVNAKNVEVKVGKYRGKPGDEILTMLRNLLNASA